MKSLHSYRQLPSPSLVKYIDKYWMVENKKNKNIDVPIIPDGCIDIISKNGEIVLVGIMEVASLVSIKPNDYYFGIRFKPSIIASLLDKDVSKFNNKIIPLSLIDTKLHNSLQNKMANIEKLNQLFEGLFNGIEFDKRIIKSVNLIELNGGNITIENLCEETKLSQKHLERLFKTHIGLTPKKFSRIIRFFQTHKHLTKEGMKNLCSKILEKGYYDQAHFNHEYKLLTGLTPTHEIMSIFYNTKK